MRVSRFFTTRALMNEEYCINAPLNMWSETSLPKFPTNKRKSSVCKYCGFLVLVFNIFSRKKENYFIVLHMKFINVFIRII